MLDHLVDKYGSVEPKDVDRNRDRLSEAWQPEEPIENLGNRIRSVRAFAREDAKEEIFEQAAMRATVKMFERTKIFLPVCIEWMKFPIADKTYNDFQTHFEMAQKVHKKSLTTTHTGYNEINLAQINISESANVATITAKTKNEQDSKPTLRTNGLNMYYGWMHGLSLSKKHTSETCRSRAEGHKANATADKMMGGCNIICTEKPPYEPHVYTPAEGNGWSQEQAKNKQIKNTHYSNQFSAKFEVCSNSTTDNPTQTTIIVAIADTGCTAYFGNHKTPVINKRIATEPIVIRNPDGSLMYSTH